MVIALAGGNQHEPVDLRGLDDALQIGFAAQHFANARLLSGAEHGVDGGSPQVAIDQQSAPTGSGQAGGQMRGHGGFAFAVAGAGDHDDLGSIGPRLLQQNGAEVIDRFRQDALHCRGAFQALGTGQRF